LSYSEKVSVLLRNKTTELFIRCLFLICLFVICLLMGYNTGLLALILAAGCYFVFVKQGPELPLWLSIIFLLPIRIPVTFLGEDYQIKLLFFGFVLISLFSCKMRLLKEKEKPKLPLILPMLVLLVFFIIGAVRSDAPLPDKPYFLRSFIFRSIFLYLLLNIYGRKDLVRLIKAISASSILMALLGIYQHIFKSYFMINCNLPEFRAMGTFDHPNVFALFVFIAGVLSVGMFFYSKALKSRIYFGAVFLLNFTALLMSYSRSLWLCLIAGLFLFFVMYNKKAVIILAGVMLIILLLLPADLKNRFMNPVNLNDPSHQIRVGLIMNGLNIIKNNPVFGIGDGNSYYQYDKYKVRDTSVVRKIHTQLIMLTAEYGIAGLTVFLYLIVAVFLNMIKIIKLLDNKDRILQYALISVFAGLLINAQFNGNFFQESYVWLIMGFGLLPGIPANMHL